MQANNNNTLLVIVTAVIALSAGVWFGLDNYGAKNVPVTKIQGVILSTAKTIDDFDLIDNKNRKFKLENLKNKWSIMFFGYTHCPDVCPMTLTTLQQLSKLFTRENLTPPQVILVTVDPQRDTPEVLDEYVGYFDKDFVAATGDLSEVQKLASELGIYFKKAAGASGDVDADDYAMDHTTSFIVFNPQAEVAAYLKQPHEAARILEDLRVIVGSYQ
ncbi:MAG: SCO family protein [Proteobacteria bacterium]|nr:SCO family protein [Pseudomonadota bacterium]